MFRPLVVTTILLVDCLFAMGADAKSETYNVPKGAQTASLITESPYKKTIGKGNKKRKQKLYVQESRTECRSKLREIKHSKWKRQSVKVQAGVDLIIVQSKSGRTGNRIVSCATQLKANFSPDSMYRFEFNEDAARCDFKLINVANIEDVFENPRPEPAVKQGASSKTQASSSPTRSVGLKIVRKPGCDDLDK